MMNTTAADSEVTSAAPWWIPYFEFFVEGILLVIVASFGIVGSVCSFVVFSTQAVHKTFHNLLLLLSVFDMVYLLTAVPLFSVPQLFSSPAINHLVVLSLPHLLPVAHIGMVGSIFSTLALSVERYLAVVHPFTVYRQKFSSRHFVVPVVVYSIVFNLPKFFELKTSCSSSSPFSTSNSSQPGWSSCPEEDQKIHLEAREIRTNSWYLNIYMLWLSTIFNIILPIIALVLLNTFITRTIEQHLENLDQIRMRPTHDSSVRGSMARTNILQRERTLRKREVTLSRINIYIVYIIVSCHTIRIIPNAWEIVHRMSGSPGTTLYWPPWMDMVVIFSHLALTTSCSLSFYIYYAKYGSMSKASRVMGLLHPFTAIRMNRVSNSVTRRTESRDMTTTEMTTTMMTTELS